MAKIDKELVRQAFTIQDILRLNNVQAEGRGNRIPCPIHHGKNSNFKFSAQGYNCFVCGERGDIFSLHAKLNGISFAESLKQLAEIAGLTKGNGEAYAALRKKAEEARIERSMEQIMLRRNKELSLAAGKAFRELLQIERELPSFEWPRYRKMRKFLEEWLDLERDDRPVTEWPAILSIYERGVFATLFDSSVFIPE